MGKPENQNWPKQKYTSWNLHGNQCQSGFGREAWTAIGFWRLSVATLRIKNSRDQVMMGVHTPMSFTSCSFTSFSWWIVEKNSLMLPAGKGEIFFNWLEHAVLLNKVCLWSTRILLKLNSPEGREIANSRWL